MFLIKISGDNWKLRLSKPFMLFVLGNVKLSFVELENTGEHVFLDSIPSDVDSLKESENDEDEVKTDNITDSADDPFLVTM